MVVVIASEQTPRERFYVSMQNARHDAYHRDPINDVPGRLTVPMGTGWAKYRRFHPGEPLITVTDADGRDWEITRRQADVFDLARTLVDGGSVTMRSMALTLGFSPSTVSRALWKLQSLGLLFFAVMPGVGTLILRFDKGTAAFTRFRALAKDKVRAWRLAAEARYSRLMASVATYNHGREDESKYLQVQPKGTYYVLGRNTSTWTVQDLREAGIL